MTSLSASKSLLLDVSYQPVGIIEWQKAIILILQEKAESLESSDIKVRTITREFVVPRVLRLIKKHHARFRAPYSKKRVFIRDHCLCAYCGDRFSYKDLTIDHVIPRCQGGATDWKNVVSACFPCNSKKGGRTPKEAGMPLLYNPKSPTTVELVVSAIRANDFPHSWETLLNPNFSS